jgi:hypothetical protein
MNRKWNLIGFKILSKSSKYGRFIVSIGQIKAIKNVNFQGIDNEKLLLPRQIVWRFWLRFVNKLEFEKKAECRWNHKATLVPGTECRWNH